MSTTPVNISTTLQSFITTSRQFLEGPFVDTVSRIWEQINKDAEKYVPAKTAVFLSPCVFFAGQIVLNRITAYLIKVQGRLGVVCKIAALAISLFQSALYFAAVAYLFGVGTTAYVIGGICSLGSVALFLPQLN